MAGMETSHTSEVNAVERLTSEPRGSGLTDTLLDSTLDNAFTLAELVFGFGLSFPRSVTPGTTNVGLFKPCAEKGNEDFKKYNSLRRISHEITHTGQDRAVD